MEVNLAGVAPGDVAIWNSHFRVGGAMGSTAGDCYDLSAPCQAAFMHLHIAPSAQVYIENMWGWTADHNLDAGPSEYVSTGRGLLVEATRGTWLVGTAFEHNTLYQYNFAGAENVFVGMQQCETPYWQGIGTAYMAPEPWTVNYTIYDPDFANCAAGDANCRMAWFALVQGGSNLYFYGSGFWTFFNNYGNCQGPSGSCQSNAIGVTNDPLPTSMYWYNLNTKSIINVIVEMGTPTATQADNPGSWGAVIGAYLVHSGLA
jgi:glucan 1,3-beta-glucosidase